MEDEPKRLYEVEITATLYVVARTERGAERVAAEALENGKVEDLAMTACIEASVVNEVRHISGSWEDAYPFGGNEKTCTQWVEDWDEYERTRPRTAAELEAAGQQRLIA